MSDDNTGDEDVPPDERTVTEEDAVVQTAYGERYRAFEIRKGGPVRGEDD